MTPKLEQSFLDKYPSILKDIGIIDVGDGWRDLVTVLCNYLELVNATKGTDLRVAHIAERYGTFDCAVEGATSLQLNLRLTMVMDMLKSLSRKTCEQCGADGVPRVGGWVTILCDEHSRGREPLEKLVEHFNK